jgi:hypothetical protein
VHEDERKLQVEVLPRWGARRVTEIRRADVRRLIEEARERRRRVLEPHPGAGRFQYAVDREELDAYAALRSPAHHLYAEQPRERVLSRGELHAGRAVGGNQIARDAEGIADEARCADQRAPGGRPEPEAAGCRERYPAQQSAPLGGGTASKVVRLALVPRAQKRQATATSENAHRNWTCTYGWSRVMK